LADGNVGASTISKKNVGRIAERIVANELESRGFRVTDLNKDGLSPNADLIAARYERTLLIQVKGSTQGKTTTGWEEWWFGYGYSNELIISDASQRMFNRTASFYRADIVVLVAMRTLKEYRCLVLPCEIAEKAAQINVQRELRRPTRKGTPHKPGPVYACLGWIPKTQDAERRRLFEEEIELLEKHMDNWDI
jgi:hypothetical protein